MADKAQGPESEPTPLLLSDDEKRVLELHDRLEQLQVEIALLTARKNYMPTSTSSSGDEDIKSAQRDVMNARAHYVLRNDIVDSVLSANPVLQAVHNGTNASPIEKDLLPALETRDQLSATLATQSNELRTILDATTTAEAETLRLTRDNKELAATLLRLADDEAQRKKESLLGDDNEKNPEVVALEDRLRESRRRWRVIKDVASAVVVGSGVDWARDPTLRRVVVDDETGDD